MSAEGEFPEVSARPVEDPAVTAAFLRWEESQSRQRQVSWRSTIGWSLALVAGLAVAGKLLVPLFL